jgi:hypothetical protein
MTTGPPKNPQTTSSYQLIVLNQVKRQCRFYLENKLVRPVLSTMDSKTGTANDASKPIKRSFLNGHQ